MPKLSQHLHRNLLLHPAVKADNSYPQVRRLSTKKILSFSNTWKVSFIASSELNCFPIKKFFSNYKKVGYQREPSLMNTEDVLKVPVEISVWVPLKLTHPTF